jgi:hypothetical protein
MCLILCFPTSTRGTAKEAMDKPEVMVTQFALNTFDGPKVVEK